MRTSSNINAHLKYFFDLAKNLPFTHCELGAEYLTHYAGSHVERDWLGRSIRAALYSINERTKCNRKKRFNIKYVEPQRSGLSRIGVNIGILYTIPLPSSQDPL